MMRNWRASERPSRSQDRPALLRRGTTTVMIGIVGRYLIGSNNENKDVGSATARTRTRSTSQARTGSRIQSGPHLAIRLAVRPVPAKHTIRPACAPHYLPSTMAAPVTAHIAPTASGKTSVNFFQADTDRPSTSGCKFTGNRDPIPEAAAVSCPTGMASRTLLSRIWRVSGPSSASLQEGERAHVHLGGGAHGRGRDGLHLGHEPLRQWARRAAVGVGHRRDARRARQAPERRPL